MLILATTGAASGMQVDIFFTFWGLRVLQKNDVRITGNNWKQKGESFMDRGGTDHLTLGKMHMGGAGTKMIKGLAEDHGVADPTELMEMAMDLGVRFHSLPDDHGPVRPEQGRLHRRPRPTARRGQLPRHGGRR